MNVYTVKLTDAELQTLKIAVTAQLHSVRRIAEITKSTRDKRSLDLLRSTGEKLLSARLHSATI